SRGGGPAAAARAGSDGVLAAAGAAAFAFTGTMRGVSTSKSSVPWPVFRKRSGRVVANPVGNVTSTEPGDTLARGGPSVVATDTFEIGLALLNSSTARTANQ